MNNSMIKNYLKITLRNLGRHPGYTFINVFGLAVGIGFCSLLFLYVNDELTFDRFHEKGDRIYRAHRVSFNDDGSPPDLDIYMPMPWGPAFERDFPEVDQVVRFCTFLNHYVRQGDITLEENVIYADPSFFEVFTFPLVLGSPETVLADQQSVVLTEKAASIYFGHEVPIGRTLEIRINDHFEPFTVTGIAENPPGNSTIQFDILIPFSKLINGVRRFQGSEENWGRSAFVTYLTLREGSSFSDNDDRLVQFHEQNSPYTEEVLRSAGIWNGEGPPVTYDLQPIQDVHLDSRIPGSMTQSSDPMYSYILLGIALAVLIIACINFTTLSVGRSVSRSREVGVRKVVGARRKQLMGQFWGESLVLSFAAFWVGLFLAGLFMPTFNELTNKSLAVGLLSDPYIFLPIATLILITSLVAGGYPAVVLSAFKPVDTLRSRFASVRSNKLTRSLVVVQFTLSVFLIISTMIMMQQLNYLRTENLGFDQEQVLAVHLNGISPTRALSFMQDELAPRVDVESIAASNLTLGAGSGWGRQGFDYNGENKQVYEYRVTPNYLDVMEIDLALGRSFNPALATDSVRSAIVNEALVQDFGWDDPIGQVLTGYTNDAEMDPVVIGVVRDYNFRPLHEEVEPMVLMASPTTGRLQTLLIRMNTSQMEETIEAVRSAWMEISPDVPFEYNFMEEDIARFYLEEERWSGIVGYSSLFAIFIACLGLLGLTSLMVTKRTKEVGIRKVLGASVHGVVGLLSTEFLKLVGIALVIAIPVAYFAMRRWLDTFSYHVELGVTVFLAAGMLTILVTLLTISYQAIRAALTNPVKALKYE